MPMARLTKSTVMRSACSARSTPGSSIMPPGWWRMAPSTASSKFCGGTWLAAARQPAVLERADACGPRLFRDQGHLAEEVIRAHQRDGDGVAGRLLDVHLAAA